MTAASAALQGGSVCDPIWPATKDKNNIVPLRASVRVGTNACAAWTTPRRLTLQHSQPIAWVEAPERNVRDTAIIAIMSKPKPKPIAPADVLPLAEAVLQQDRFPYLATIDGDQPRLRPVSPVRTDGFTVYVANLRGYHKTAEIAANPKVELCYLSDGHDQVRITGSAEVVRERAMLESIWEQNPLLRQYLGSIDNPELIVYRIVPARVRFMREWALQYHDVDFQEDSDLEGNSHRSSDA
jgi:general stress protein 26